MSQRHSTTLEHIFGSQVRARLIVALVSEPGRQPYFRELAREAGATISFTRRELRLLMDLGLVRQHRCVRGLFFRVNQCHPLYLPLQDLVRAARVADDGDGLAFERPPLIVRPYRVYW
jgi:hypothetical protein